MPILRQSTSQVIRFGTCLDKDDGVTEENSLTLAQADMRLSKDGGAFAQKNASGNATNDSDGWYSTTLNTTDTATVGELILNVHQPANMLPVQMRWWVLEEAVYDMFYGAAASPGNMLAAHFHRITVANIESNSTADTIADGVPSAYNIIVANVLKYQVEGAFVVSYDDGGTAIGKRAMTVNANTQIIELGEYEAM